jgi:hypothetical protein
MYRDKQRDLAEYKEKMLQAAYQQKQLERLMPIPQLLIISSV